MKLLISLLAIYIVVAKCEEGCILQYEPLEGFDISWLSGKTWYSIFSYENSYEKNVSCTTNSVDAAYNIKKTYLYSNGESKEVNGKFAIDKMCKCNLGRLVTSWPPGFPLIKYVVYFEEDFHITVACFEGAGKLRHAFDKNILIKRTILYSLDLLSVLSEEKYPCKKVLKKIDDVIKEKHFDRHELVRK